MSNLIKTLIAIGCVLTFSILGLILYNQEKIKSQQTAIQSQIVSQQQLVDGIVRSQSQYATSSDLAKFAANNNINLQAIQDNLKTLNSTLSSINVITSNSNGQNVNNQPSSGIGQTNPNPPTVITVPCNSSGTATCRLLTLQLIVKIVTEMTDADSVFIYLFDESKQNLVLMASKTAHKKELGNVVLKTGEGITGWVARENKTVAIKSRAYRDPRFKSFDVLPEDRYEAFLSVPIIYKGKAIGVVNVQHKSQQDYSTETVNLIEMIAKQVGGIIEHARLFEETKKKALQFDSLIKVSRSITSEHYLDEILNLIVVVTAEMLNSKICSIMLLDEKGPRTFDQGHPVLKPGV